jgi:DNA-directed RNA polymerase specialized sigma24 family protein
MATTQAGIVLGRLRGLLADKSDGRPGDGQLLERFASLREESAFAALLQRHGPMVLGVCRRVLRDGHDAEDAFQTTFLTLAQRAGTLGRRESVGGWLYRVAYNAALKARGARRRGSGASDGRRTLRSPTRWTR